MSKELKQLMAGDLREHLEKVEDVLVVGLLPLDAEKTVELRQNLRDGGGYLRVIHNRTARHALDDRRKDLDRYFHGQTALALPSSDETETIPMAKALLDAARKKRLELRGGFVDGEILDEEGLRLLALSPDRPTLRAMTLGVILGSARGLAVALQGVGGGLARCLKARIDQEGGGEAAE